MATAERDRPAVIVGTARDAVRNKVVGNALAANAARALYAAGLIFLIGSIADIMTLWVMQAQPDPEWEFSSLVSTIEGTPRIVLAIAMLLAGNYFRGTSSLVAQKLFASILLLLGLAGAVIGALILSDYFVVRGAVEPDKQKVFLSVVLKALTLSALHVLILVPVGVLGLRRPKG
jgi:hypothetical protein